MRNVQISADFKPCAFEMRKEFILKVVNIDKIEHHT